MKTMLMPVTDKMIEVQLHISDFDYEDWKYFSESSYWFQIIFKGLRIIRIITWESNYPHIAERYNFNKK